MEENRVWVVLSGAGDYNEISELLGVFDTREDANICVVRTKAAYPRTWEIACEERIVNVPTPSDEWIHLEVKGGEMDGGEPGGMGGVVEPMATG